MARLAGVDLPNHKRIDIALTSVYGVGRTIAVDLVEKAGIQTTKKSCRSNFR
jgi:small subunit ribosomal protein S13